MSQSDRRRTGCGRDLGSLSEGPKRASNQLLEQDEAR